MLFALSLGILMGVFERAPESITGGTVRKTLSWIGGRGFVDPVPEADDTKGVAASTAASTTSDTSRDSEESTDSQGSVVLGSLCSTGDDFGEE